MYFKQSVSALAIASAGVLGHSVACDRAQAQVANTTPSSVNVLNLLAPYLNLNATAIGQATLAANLQQAIVVNNGADATTQARAISDENLLGNASNTVKGLAGTYGPGENLAGGLPAQARPAGALQTPVQPVGGLGPLLGPIFQMGVRPIAGGGNGQLSNTVTLLTSAYSFTSRDLGVAKFYFANGTTNGTTTAVAPAGYTLPTANGLPNRTDSVYDIAYGVTNKQPNQDIYGSSRPVQVRPNSFIPVDPSALQGLESNPSFPSGHTTYAFTDSILIAMLVPQAYQSMLLRASEYGNSRIVLGVHYPLDIIASRALVTYDLAQAFTNPLYINNATTTGGTGVNLPALFTAASTQLQGTSAGTCGATFAACATSAGNMANNPYAPSAANQALYQQRLTYGLPTLTYVQAPREAAPAGGPDASILLAPLYGGSTAAAKTLAPNGGIYANLATSTINQIVVNTEGEALAAFYGSPLSYWTRVDLYSAAGYFGGAIGTLSLQPTDVVNTNVTIASTGNLSADGRINGTVHVLSGGRLAGSGNVGSTSVDAGGVLAPGSLAAQSALQAGQANVTGTRLTVNGALTLSRGSTLAIFATPSQATSVGVTGAAAVAGSKVDVQANGGKFSLAQRYTILTAAGGVTGRFASTSTNLPFLAAGLSYSPTDVTLSFTPNGRALQNAASTQNELSVAQGLLAGGQTPGNKRNPVLNAVVNLQTPAQARAAFNALSGEGIAAAQNVANRSAQLFTSSIFDQTTFYAGGGAANSVTLTDRLPGSPAFLALAPTERAPIRELADLPAARVEPAAPLPVGNRTWRAWATGWGGIEDISGNRTIGSAAQHNDIYGGTLGVDYQLLPNYLVGVAVGGSNGDFRVDQRGTSGRSSGGHVAIYDLLELGPWYGASSTSFSYFGNQTTRFASGFGGLGSETERGNFNSNEFRTRMEFGRHFASLPTFGALPALGGFGTVTPFLAVEIAELRSNGFTETSLKGGPGLFRLNVSGQSAASVPGYAGLRFQRVTPLGDGMVLAPTLQVAYIHEFAPYRNQIGTIASLPGSTFLVDGARPARDAAQVKAGGELILGPHSALFANFDGEFSGINQLYAGKGGFRYTW